MRRLGQEHSAGRSPTLGLFEVGEVAIGEDYEARASDRVGYLTGYGDGDENFVAVS